jgi:alanine racemase
VTVNLDAISNNTARVKSLLAENTEIMGIVKANAYGHGLLESAHAMLKGGASWLGVAKISEALQLREYLDADTLECSHSNTRIFSWIYGPDAPFSSMLRAQLDVSVSTLWEIEKFAAAARHLGGAENGHCARLHIKIDTGFGRNGFTNVGNDFEKALRLIGGFQQEGLVVLEGIWSHLANADSPNNLGAVQKTRQQNELFQEYIAYVENAGFRPKYKHISASAGTLLYPEMRYNLVRPGIALYGLSPNPDEIDAAKFGLQPAMKLEVQMNNVKRVHAGEGVSYGHVYHTSEETNLGIVPLGYADGILRSCGGDDQRAGAPVLVGDKVAKIAGRVCMDQFMIDIGPETSAKAGDWVTLFGFQNWEPSVNEWAKAGGTISYEILSKTTSLAPIRYISAPKTGMLPKVIV